MTSASGVDNGNSKDFSLIRAGDEGSEDAISNDSSLKTASVGRCHVCSSLSAEIHSTPTAAQYPNKGPTSHSCFNASLAQILFSGSRCNIFKIKSIMSASTASFSNL